MPDSAAVPPIDRALAVFETEPVPALRCSNCGDTVTDDDPECTTCDSPIDWGASAPALRSWKQSGAGS